MPCSVGFSAILYGLFAWEIASGNSSEFTSIIIAIVFNILVNTTSDMNNKPSLINHLLGLISGFILGSLNFL
jgi:hypothetical protein